MAAVQAALDRRVCVRLTDAQREALLRQARTEQRSSASVLREALVRLLHEREVAR